MTAVWKLSYSYQLIMLGPSNVPIGDAVTNSGSQSIGDATLTAADITTLATNAGADMATWLNANANPDWLMDNTQA